MNTHFTNPLNTNVVAGHYVAPPGDFTPALYSSPEVTITASGTSVMLSRRAGEPPFFTADLGAEPLCAEMNGDTLFIMTPDGCHRIVVSSGGNESANPAIAIPPPRQLPPVRFAITPCGLVQKTTVALASTSGVSLTDGIPPGSTLYKKITAAINGAYSELATALEGGRMFMQPVLARCRFVDSSGATVMLSCPQLLGGEPMWQCLSELTATITRQSDTSFTINPFVLSAEAWRPEITIPAGFHPAMQGIAAVQVEMSDPVDFFDLGLPASVRIARAQGSQPVCIATLAGAGYGSVAAIRSRLCSMLAKGVDFKVVMTLTPEQGEMPVTITPPVRDMPAELRTDAVPANFAAAHCVRSGNTTAWANITPLPFTPPAPQSLLVPGTESFSCTVRFHTPSGLLCASSGTVTAASREFIPLLLCPDPEVSLITMTFDDTGDVISAPMRPNGPFAIAFADDPLPALPAAADTPVAPAPAPGTIISARADDPLVPVSTINACPGAITGITPACRSQSSWDFARTHLIALSTAGIHAVCFNSRAGYVSSTLIDPRAAPAGGLFAPDAVYVPVEGGIVTVTGARSRSFVPLPFDVNALSFREPEQLVLCRGDDGNALWISPSGEVALTGAPGYVECRFLLPPGRGGAFLKVPLLATHFSGTVKLLGDSGDASAPQFCYGCASLSGPLTSPLVMRVARRPPAFRTSVAVSGTASPDFSITTPAIL